MRIGTVSIETHDGQHFFRVEVSLGGLDPEELKVELYADAGQKGAPAIELMTVCKTCANSKGATTYSAQISATRPAEEYTVRIIPQHANASVPLEAAQILWQR